MLGKSPNQNQTNLFKPILKKIINPQDSLVILASEIDWAELEKEFAPLYSNVNATLENKEFKLNKIAQFVFKRFRVKKEITSYNGTTIVSILEAVIYYSQNTVLSALRSMDLAYNFYEYLILFLDEEKRKEGSDRTFSATQIDSLISKLKSSQNALKVYVGKTNLSTDPDSNFRVLDLETYKLMIRNE